MSDTFTAITTQEQLNAVIKDRLERAEKSYQEKYADYESLKSQKLDLEKKVNELTKTLTDTTSKVAVFEKTLGEKDIALKNYESQSVKQRIAHEVGLPYEMAERIKGTTEEEIRKDADSLFKAIQTSRPTAPLASNETGADQNTEAYRTMLHQLLKK